jgi:hypothetical protein
MANTSSKPRVLRWIVLVVAAVFLWLVGLLAYALSPAWPLRGLD